MKASEVQAPVFAGVRLLDLSSPLANFAAVLFSVLGADVIKVEPPHGDPLRGHGPMVPGPSEHGAGIDFLANNLNKRGITLNLDHPEGQELLRRLATHADLILETADPGWMDQRGVGFTALSRENERLIYTAVTPFGQRGPHSQWRAGEFSLQAMGGALHLTGEPGERPVRAGGRVAEKMAGYVAGTAMVLALNARARVGRGQLIDVSAQEAVAWQMESSQVTYSFSGQVRDRSGSNYPSSCPAGIYPSSDGYVSIVASKVPQWTGLRDWIGDQRLYEERYLIDSNRLADRDFINGIISEWTASMPKAELFRGGQARGIPIGQSMTPAELVHDEHLRHRGYLVRAHDPSLGDFEVPGGPFKLTDFPAAVRRPAPRLGEHNAEIYAELGLQRPDLQRLATAGAI